MTCQLRLTAPTPDTLEVVLLRTDTVLWFFSHTYTFRSRIGKPADIRHIAGTWAILYDVEVVEDLTNLK